VLGKEQPDTLVSINNFAKGEVRGGRADTSASIGVEGEGARQRASIHTYNLVLALRSQGKDIDRHLSCVRKCSGRASIHSNRQNNLAECFIILQRVKREKELPSRKREVSYVMLNVYRFSSFTADGISLGPRDKISVNCSA
jgi:hypothetical protein